MARRQKIPQQLAGRQREQVDGTAGSFAFHAEHSPSNLPAGSSLGLDQPLLLVLIVKFLLLAKSSGMEFSKLTIHAIKLHVHFLNIAELKAVKSLALKAIVHEFESHLCYLLGGWPGQVPNPLCTGSSWVKPCGTRRQRGLR